MSICVLGRGKSVGKYYPMRSWEKMYFVNNMVEEMKGVVVPDGVEMIHVAGRKGATAMNRVQFDRVVINAIDKKHHCNIKRYKDVECEYRPNYMDVRGYPSVGWKKIVKGKFDAALKSNNGNCWPTTGLFAIDLACMENHPCDMYLYGFDFYKEPYLIKPNRSYQTQKNPKIKMMYVYMQKLVTEFQDVEFYCASKLDMEGENWHRI